METMAMHARMNHPAFTAPGAMDALQALGKSNQRSGLPAKTAELVALRASQINGCGVCATQHPEILRKLGETDQRIFAVAAWRDAPFFSNAERAALALTRPGRAWPIPSTRSRTRFGRRPPATTTSSSSRGWCWRSPTSTSGTA